MQDGIYQSENVPRLMSVNSRKSLFKVAGRKVRLQQNRVGRRTALFPGPEPSTCPEIRLACCPKASSVPKGVDAGKPPPTSTTPTPRRASHLRTESRRRSRRRGRKQMEGACEAGVHDTPVALLAKAPPVILKPGVSCATQASAHQTANLVK